MSKTNYGVITEQGYPVGQGLGFSSVSENDLNQQNNIEKNKDIDHYKKSEKGN